MTIEFIEKARNCQLYLLQEKDNCASHLVNWISKNTRSFEDSSGAEYFYKRVTSSVEAFLMPVAVATAILQETTTLCSELIIRCTFKKGHGNINDSATTIYKLAIAFFATLLVDIALVPLFRPDIYERKLEDSQSTSTVQETSPVDIGASQTKTPMEILDGVEKFAYYCVKESSKALEGSPVSLKLSDLKQEGFDEEGFKLDDKNLDALLYPLETFIVHLKDSSCTEILPKIFSKTDKIDALVLEGCSDIKGILNLISNSEKDKKKSKVVGSIHLLSIRGKVRDIEAENIEEIAQKFPNLKAVDLRESNIQEGFSKSFLEKTIVVFKETNNAQLHLEAINKAINKAKKDGIDAIEKLFCEVKQGSVKKCHPISPASCFIQNFSYLKDLDIGAGSLNYIIRSIQQNFHSLRYADFSGNNIFNLSNFEAMHTLPLHELNVTNCDQLKEDFKDNPLDLVTKALFADDLRTLNLGVVSMASASKLTNGIRNFLQKNSHNRGLPLKVKFVYENKDRTVEGKPLKFGG